MGITIGNLSFEGPFSNTDGLQSRSGVYAILGTNGTDGLHVLDIGESGDVKGRVTTHDRKESWSRCGYRNLSAAAYYCQQAERMRIETTLRQTYNPPCGER
jgi:hypothetical protein